MHENREISCLAAQVVTERSTWEDEESKPMKNEREKSDPCKVAKRPANKPKVAEVGLWACGAESVEPMEGADVMRRG